MNPALLDQAMREVHRTLKRAWREDAEAQRELLRYVHAEALEATLARLAVIADKCAPTLDEIRVCGAQYSYDAQQLRFEVDRVANVLNRAAGRAVVLEMPERQRDDAPPSPSLSEPAP